MKNYTINIKAYGKGTKDFDTFVSSSNESSAVGKAMRLFKKNFKGFHTDKLVITINK